jgi:lysine 6-dehydrogenase
MLLHFSFLISKFDFLILNLWYLMKKITILGAGMVGSAIASDLVGKYEVSIVDINKTRLEELKNLYELKTMEADLTDPNAVAGAIQNSELVIGAVPGYLGFETLKRVIKDGIDVIDISFFNQDPFLLDELAKEKNVTAVVDCGVAPGLSNIILGYYNKKIKVDKFECIVGGLPKKRIYPFQYKASFSPIDVIEEYIRPARIVQDGEIITKPALSDAELINVDPVGTLEAFNTDGLRTLLRFKIPNMKEKTLRFPGHIDYIRMLRDTGFFNEEQVDLEGLKIRPIELSAKLIFPHWKLEKNEEEFTVMRINITGTEKGVKKEFIYNLYDEYDKEKNNSSMGRTTGFTCTAAANLILEGNHQKKGIISPEMLGEKEDSFNFIFNYLNERNINISFEEKEIS